MRTFIAIEFPVEIIQKIDNIISFLKAKTPAKAIKWVSADNLHLTLKFIGDYPDQKLEELIDILDHALKPFPVFDMIIQGMGMYPNEKNPRVIWFGISHDETILKIHKILDDSLQKVGVKPDRRDFDAHLTIARIRRRTGKAIIQEIGTILSNYTVDALGQVTVDGIILMKSDLTPQGPIYTPLHRVPLNRV